jgi:hypothetical protein
MVGVQVSCKDKFVTVISAILPPKKCLSNQCLFRDWIPEVKDESCGYPKLMNILTLAKQQMKRETAMKRNEN